MKDERHHAAGALDSLIAKNASPETAYLKQLKASHRARARAAMRWRPRFLKALAITCSYTHASKAARVCYNTVRAHERNDPEFAAQVREAEEQAAQVLHAACWKSAIEGDIEPVYWQGIKVGEIKRYDSRIRVELLRAHMPHMFKRDQKQVQVNIDQRRQFLITPEVAADLARRHREGMERRRKAAIEQGLLPPPTTPKDKATSS